VDPLMEIPEQVRLITIAESDLAQRRDRLDGRVLAARGRTALAPAGVEC
jgi:hypothetical protein